MRVQVVLHTILRDLLPPNGRGEVEFDGSDVSSLLDHLGVDQEVRELIVVNGQQVNDLGSPLSQDDKVEVFPAVSGGAQSPYMQEALRLYRAGDYFMTHEILEEHWLEAEPEERDFLQGLIHLAVGLHHHARGNVTGATLQFRKASKRLAQYQGIHQGVDVALIKSFLDSAQDAIKEQRELTAPAL